MTAHRRVMRAGYVSRDGVFVPIAEVVENGEVVDTYSGEPCATEDDAMRACDDLVHHLESTGLVTRRSQ